MPDGGAISRADPTPQLPEAAKYIHIGSLAGLVAKALTEQVGDIGLIIYDQDA
jgi:hypothetical protein